MGVGGAFSDNKSKTVNVKYSFFTVWHTPNKFYNFFIKFNKRLISAN